jgi:uncharacterized membrane protein
MGKDTIEAAQRVIARIEQRREVERVKNRKASAMLESAAKMKLIGDAQWLPEKLAQLSAIHTDALGDHIAMMRNVWIYRPQWVGIDLAAQAKRCICCGAPADRVQHD